MQCMGSHLPIKNELLKQSQRFEHWMRQHALPLWASRGIERDSGAGYEALFLSAAADKMADRRTRVQGRQMFVFAVAAEKGWLAEGHALVQGIQHYLDRYARHTKIDGAYAFKLDRRHQVVDNRLDTYDCAFFLLAWAYQHKVFAEPMAKVRAERLMTALEDRFGAPGGGYLEGDYPSAIRRQNPHMHLFEAFLAWYEVCADEVWLNRARGILRLFEQAFFDHEKGVLYEYFDQNMGRLDTPQGQIVEPGHLMEWVWLLREYERLSGVSMDSYCQALYQRGLQWGMDDQCGLLFDEINAQGQVLKAGKRLWTVTELLKAHLAQARAGDKAAEGRAAMAIDSLFRYHLDTPMAGLYIERLDPQLKPLDQPCPATSMYHLMLACLETVKYCQDADTGNIADEISE